MQAGDRIVLSALGRDFSAERILFEDEHVVAVDKPPGVPCLPGGGAPDGEDLKARVQRFLADRDGVDVERVALRAPETIEREASGVVVFAKTKEAASALARDVEARRVERSFTAVAAGRHSPPSTLHDRSSRGRGGAAVTEVRVVESDDDATLLELRVREGRPAQIRGQLADAGLPILGDRDHRGRRSARLHLASLHVAVAHPASGASLRIDAPLPFAMRAALGGAHAALDRGALFRAIAEAAELRRPLLQGRSAPEPTTAFRLLHESADGARGLALDVYGEHLVAHLFEGELHVGEDVVLDALAELGAAGVYVKRRPKNASTLDDARREELAPRHAVRGVDAPDAIVVHEHGVPFLAWLGDGLSTGIFLDQRDNRRRVRAWATGARVLNLFAYTGAFTVAAAVGGARETLSVDASGAAIEHLEQNLENAGVRGPAHAVEKSDAFETLERLHARGERFDLVIVDPPTYSTTKHTRWASGRGWEELARACIAVTAPGGRLLACSNEHRGRPLGERIRRVLSSDRIRADVVDEPPPLDFPPGAEVGTTLQTVIVSC